MNARQPAPPQSPTIGAVLLGSTDPERLWGWYRTAFAPEAQREEGVLALELAGNTYLIFEQRDDVAAETVEPGRLIVNFDVTDIRATERWLNQELAVRWIRPVTDMDGEAYLATLADPDGNYIQLVQLIGSEQAESGARAATQSEPGTSTTTPGAGSTVNA